MIFRFVVFALPALLYSQGDVEVPQPVQPDNAAAKTASQLSGTIRNATTNEVMAKVLVTLRQMDRPGEHMVVTNQSGQYKFPAVASGTYIVIASRDRFIAQQYGSRR